MLMVSCGEKTFEQNEIETYCWTCKTIIIQYNYECGILKGREGSGTMGYVTKCDMTTSDARNYEASLGSFTSVIVDATPCTFNHPARMYTKEIRVTCTQQK